MVSQCLKSLDSRCTYSALCMMLVGCMGVSYTMFWGTLTKLVHIVILEKGEREGGGYQDITFDPNTTQQVRGIHVLPVLNDPAWLLQILRSLVFSDHNHVILSCYNHVTVRWHQDSYSYPCSFPFSWHPYISTSPYFCLQNVFLLLKISPSDLAKEKLMTTIMNNNYKRS